jgi:hypothetical protein
LQNYLFRGGPEPRCSLVADVLFDGVINLADSMALLSAALPGDTELRPLEANICGGADPSVVPEPARIGIGWEAPRKAVGSAEATLQIETRDRPVQAWSVAIEAEGCAIAGVTTDGTAAGWAGEGKGLRAATSYDYLAFDDATARAGAVLDWRGDAKLTVQAEPWSVLRVEVEPTGAGCSDCTLRALPGRGEGRVDSVATVGGWSYPLPAAEARFELCL